MSPQRFTAIVYRPIVRHGNRETHQPRTMTLRPSFAIDPHSAVGGCTPTPRKLREEAASTANARESVASTSTLLITFGSRCRNMIRVAEQPMDFAAVT